MDGLGGNFRREADQQRDGTNRHGEAFHHRYLGYLCIGRGIWTEANDVTHDSVTSNAKHCWKDNSRDPFRNECWTNLVVEAETA